MSKRCRRYQGSLVGGAGPRFAGTPHLFTSEGYVPLSATTMAMIAALATQVRPSGRSVRMARQEILRKLVVEGGRAAKALPPRRQAQLFEELAAFGRRCRT